MEISIIIPSYNEEKRIGKSLEKIWKYFKNKGFPFEIIVVDDGSTDKTVEIVEKFKEGKKEIRILKHDKNKGKGAAVRTGVINSKGNLILFTDADLSTPIEEFEKFYKYGKSGFDIVIGTRRIKNAEIKKKQPFLRRFFGTGFIYLVKIFFPSLSKITDFTCGFKLFNVEKNKKIFKLQKIDRWGFDVEILLIATILHLKILQVPVVWSDLRKSKVNLKKDIIRSFFDLIRIKKFELIGYYKNE
ncbi:MAG TPA: glycosyltransferase family 2 protein [Candidatus Ratteibacteria bacterium]|nr:glycosyltransferase family 2 protein [Candidatus Ratteibacteria bacterium]